MMIMPKLTATRVGNVQSKTRCLGLLPKGTVLVAVGSGKTEATGFSLRVASNACAVA